MEYHDRIGNLASIFSKYRIYPKDRYGERSPVRVFQHMFPNNHFSNDVEVLLNYQDYQTNQIGADLPWWGKEYFSQKPGIRTVVVS